MAGLADVCSLVLTSAFFIGVILGTMLIAQKCRALIDATQASLEERGWMVSGAPPPSSSGGGKGAGNSTNVVVVKRSKKKMDHERYLDATQRKVVKALNASTFGAPSSESQSQTTAAGPSSVLSSPPSSSPFGAMRSTFAQFRSHLSLSPLAQPHQLESANSGQGSPAGRGVGPAMGGGGARASTNSGGGADGGRGGGATGSATSDSGGTSRDSSLYDMADRLSAWPSEKIEKAKRLRDQFLSKA